MDSRAVIELEREANEVKGETEKGVESVGSVVVSTVACGDIENVVKGIDDECEATKVDSSNVVDVEGSGERKTDRDEGKVG